MKSKCLITVLCLMATTALAQKPSNFSGTWQFVAQKSSNVGMMGQMKITETIVQTDSSLDATSHAIYMGKDDESRTHYDLTGKPATNESPRLSWGKISTSCHNTGDADMPFTLPLDG